MRLAISLTLGAAVLLAGLGASPSSTGNELARFDRYRIAFEYPECVVRDVTATQQRH